MFKTIAKFFSYLKTDSERTNSIQEREATVELNSTQSPRTRLEANRQLAIEHHNAILERLVVQHSRVLRKKIKRHLRQDEYGKDIGLNEAGGEVAYFISHVAKTEAEYRHSRQRVIDLHIQISLLGQNPDEFDLESYAADVSEQFDLNLIGYVYVLAIGGSEPNGLDTDASLESLTGEEFEIYCEDRLRDFGWSVHRKGGVGDQGVDLIASKAGIAVAIQCKRYASAVGNHAIQQVEAGRQFDEADFAAVVSNNIYTPSAQKLASKLGVILLHYSELDLLEERLRIR